MIFAQGWRESNHGVKEVVDKDGNIKFEYDINKNFELARNPKGKLLLVTSDIDDNIHPGGNLKMVALIKTDKHFDFFTFPG